MLVFAQVWREQYFSFFPGEVNPSCNTHTATHSRKLHHTLQHTLNWVRSGLFHTLKQTSSKSVLGWCEKFSVVLDSS